MNEKRNETVTPADVGEKSEGDTDVSPGNMKKIGDIIPDGWELIDVEDRTYEGNLKFDIKLKPPLKIENTDNIDELWIRGYSNTVGGYGTIEQFETGLQKLQERIEEEQRAHLIAQNLLSSDEAVAELIQKKQEENRVKEEEEERERQERIKRDEERAKQREKNKKEEQRKQEIKNGYRPAWLQQAKNSAKIDEKREQERQRFKEKFELNDEQYDAFVIEKNSKSAPYLEIDFKVAGLTVRNAIQREEEIDEYEYPYLHQPTIDDKSIEMAKALADVISGQVVYKTFRDEYNDYVYALIVENVKDEIEVQRKAYEKNEGY